MSGSERWREDNWRRSSRGSYEPSVASSGSTSAGNQARGRQGSRPAESAAAPAAAASHLPPWSPERDRGGRQGYNRGRGQSSWRSATPGSGGATGWLAEELSRTNNPISPTESVRSILGPPPPQRNLFNANRPATLEPRLSDSTQDALVTSLQSLRVSGAFPHRPGWGTVGERARYRVNHFPISMPKAALYDYRVKIEPKVAITRMRKRIYAILEDSPEFSEFKDHIVHDNASRMIASRLLPIPAEGKTIVIRYFDEDEEGPTDRSPRYTVTIAYNTQLDADKLSSFLSGDPNFRSYDTTPIISALNLIVSAHPSKTGILVGRNRFFFPDPDSTKVLGCGLEAFRGYTSSVRATFKQMMVNVNVCTTAFYKAGNLADAMIEFIDGGGGRLGGFVTGLRVETLHLGHKNKKTIKRVGDLSARQQAFICEEYGNASITVEQYFLRKYEIELQRAADLPVVDVGPNKEKPIWLPAEVCQIIPYQPFRGKIPDDATTKMIGYACHYPHVNAGGIVTQGLRHLGLQTSKALPEFGVQVGSEMTVVPGRVLPPPQIAYGRGSVRIDDRASWNLREVTFIEPKPLSNWAVLVIRDGGRSDFVGAHDPNLVNILNEFSRICNRSGMSVLSDPTVTTVTLPAKDARNDPSRSDAIDAIHKALLRIRPKPTFVLIMLSNGDKNVYTGLKSLCDLKLDVHTVCVHSNKIRKDKGQLQFFANLAMKINMKLGGVNHTLDAESLQWLTEEPTMMIGSDVTHPTPESLKGTPSIAAVVGSVDAKFAHYPASLRLQESRKEMITDLAAMVKERLEEYRAKTTRLPKRIVFFRDGVSEGQYATVTREELPKIQEACTKMTKGGTYRPKITLCIAGKRHHTRFYPVDATGSDRNGNPRPGTVVDRGVTAIYDHDFFLQAHGGLQGTTRPTHYYVVHDDNNFSADALQRLTNSTSYMFGRATRAVSLIPPAYYADLACDRGRCYIHDLLTAGETGSLGEAASSEEKVFREAQRLWGDGVGQNLRKTMFYL